MKKNDKRLKKLLGRKDVVFLSFGAMIGWGWVVLAGSWTNSAGSLGAIISFIFGGVLIIFVGLTYSELTSAMPIVGGEQFFAFKALGVKASFICAWAILLGYISVISFEAVALPTVIEYLFPHYKVGFLWSIANSNVYLSWVLIAIIGSILITLINYLGIKVAAFLQTVFAIGIALVGLMLIIGSFINGNIANLKPLFVDGYKGIFAVITITPFMFLGFNVIPQIVEEIDLPKKTIGSLLIFSVLIAAVWYILIIFGVSMSMNPSKIRVSSLVTADAMTALFHGSWAGKLLIMGGICGIFSTWNAFYIGCSRIIYAMAQVGMLPSILGKLHKKYKTPHNAIIFIGIISIFAPLLGRKMLIWLASSGSLGIMIAYSIVAISFVVLRKKDPHMKRPFKVKNGITIGIIAIILSLVFIVSLILPGSPVALLWPFEWVIVLGWALIGFILFLYAKFSYGERNIKKNMDYFLNSKLNKKMNSK